MSNHDPDGYVAEEDVGNAELVRLLERLEISRGISQRKGCMKPRCSEELGCSEELSLSCDDDEFDDDSDEYNDAVNGGTRLEETDKTDEDAFYLTGCGCKLQCCVKIPQEEAEDLRLALSGLDKSERDLVILSKLSCGMSSTSTQRQAFVLFVSGIQVQYGLVFLSL